MAKKSLHRKHLILAASVFASIGLAIANGPAVAQQTSAQFKPAVDTITITTAPIKNLPEIMREISLGQAYAVSASIPVPYSDLDLSQERGAAELGRRINVAAHLVCQQLDIMYPSSQYAVLDGGDCEQTAAKDGATKANLVIAAAKRTVVPATVAAAEK